jgi:hypothetical protein
MPGSISVCHPKGRCCAVLCDAGLDLLCWCCSALVLVLYDDALHEASASLTLQSGRPCLIFACQACRAAQQGAPSVDRNCRSPPVPTRLRHGAGHVVRWHFPISKLPLLPVPPASSTQCCRLYTVQGHAHCSASDWFTGLLCCPVLLAGNAFKGLVRCEAAGHLHRLIGMMTFLARAFQYVLANGGRKP